MPPYPDSQLYNPYRSMPDWLPWIFSQMSNRKMLDFKSCVHGWSTLPSPCPMNHETIIQFIFSAKTSRNHNDNYNSFRCLWLISPTYKQTVSLFSELWVVQIQDWFMTLHCASCVVEFKNRCCSNECFCSHVPCLILGHVSSVAWAAHAGYDNDNAEHHWRSWLQAHCAY